MSATRGMDGGWDSLAATFDEQPDHGLADPVVRAAWSDLLLRWLVPVPARVADLGCGTGSLSVLLAERGCGAVGLDSSAAMAATARAKASRFGVEVEVCLGDAADPPFRPGIFDAVLCRHLLWALADPLEALRRWVELLAPGGRLLLLEGRWWTGEGISAAGAAGMLAELGREARLVSLQDARLWGSPISDEGYLLVSPLD